MAYLRTIAKPKCHCGKNATKSLFNRFNAECGYYCTSCAKRALGDLEAAERACQEVKQ